MGEIAPPQRDLVCSYLRMINQAAAEVQIGMYADYFTSYMTASDNIRRHGEIVQHPRTGAPIPNPYIPVRDSAAKMLKTFKLRTGGLSIGRSLIAVCLRMPANKTIVVGIPSDNGGDACEQALSYYPKALGAATIPQEPTP